MVVIMVKNYKDIDWEEYWKKHKEHMQSEEFKEEMAGIYKLFDEAIEKAEQDNINISKIYDKTPSIYIPGCALEIKKNRQIQERIMSVALKKETSLKEFLSNDSVCSPFKYKLNSINQH